uniref:Uncharacterized protein n=1 Tax=Kalanchoe fedtschenkoi TaxID=63787 RepID=A0A7N0U2L7_KALFE
MIFSLSPRRKIKPWGLGLLGWSSGVTLVQKWMFQLLNS